jgi:hypothetical protein
MGGVPSLEGLGAKKLGYAPEGVGGFRHGSPSPRMAVIAGAPVLVCNRNAYPCPGTCLSRRQISADSRTAFRLMMHALERITTGAGITAFVCKSRVD